MSRLLGTKRSPHWFGFAHATAVAVLLGAAVSANAASDPDYPPLFGTREVHSTDLASFPKWTKMLDRYSAENDAPESTCKETPFTKCPFNYWQPFLDTLRGANPMTQLLQIHQFINNPWYITDPRNYNLPDYWATPRQFLERDGDCEDYAIAKYMSLRVLGWEREHLRIVVLQDLNLGNVHAVLVAYNDGKAWVLDNQVKQIVAADRIVHYRPYYSINEDGWWLHHS